MDIDISMVVLLPMLMAYSLIGEKFHEVVGTVMFALFIVHHILNRKWFRTLFKGKYSPARIFRTVINLFLLVFMFMQPISGIFLSKHLYNFLPIHSGMATAREIHLVMAYWGFVVLCLHAGTHLSIPFNKLKKNRENTWKILKIIFSVISVYGIYALIKNHLPEYMFMKTSFVFFDYGRPLVFFFADYIAIMILFAFLCYLLVIALKKIH